MPIVLVIFAACFDDSELALLEQYPILIDEGSEVLEEAVLLYKLSIKS